MSLSESDTPIPGDQLLRVAERLTQVIDGDFTGRDVDAMEPWVVVKAIDSSWWEVWTDDAAAHEALRRRFCAVSQIPEQAP